MTTTGVTVIGVLGLTLALTPRAAGAADILAQLTHLEGGATVHRGYVAAPAYSGLWLTHGDEVRTTAGRAEITFRDGSVLHVDRDTRVVVHEGERFSVLDGRVFFRTTAASLRGYEAQTDIVRVRVLPRGVFGILSDQKNRQVLVSVAVGEAHVDSAWGGTRLTSRQMAMVSGATGRPFVTPFFPGRFDSFESWSSSRVLEATLSPSSPWPPVALEAAGPVIDHYRESSIDTGAWIAIPPTWYPYGTVRHPRLSPSGRFRGRGHDRIDDRNPFFDNSFRQPQREGHAQRLDELRNPPRARPEAAPKPVPPPPAPRPPVVLPGAAAGFPSPRPR